MKKLQSAVKPVESVQNPREALAEILHRFGQMETELKKMKAEFVDAFQKPSGAAYAISWKSEKLVGKEFCYSEVAGLLDCWNKKSEAEKTPEMMLGWLKEIKNRLVSQMADNRFRPCSTSAYHNAEEIAKAEAVSSFLRYDLASMIANMERNMEVVVA